MDLTRIRIGLWLVLLMSGAFAGAASAADAGHMDITPQDGNYATRTDEPGARGTDAEGVAATFAFERLDSNRNLTISPSEAQASKTLAKQFSQVDRNHDFQITPSEFSAFEVEQMRAAQRHDQGNQAQPDESAHAGSPADKAPPAAAEGTSND